MNKASNIYVRRLTYDDLQYTQEIVSMINSAYSGNGGWTSITSYEYRVDAEDISKRISRCANEKSFIILGAFEKQSHNTSGDHNDSATRKDPIVGILHIDFKEDQDGKAFAEATRLAVKPMYQSKYVASTLYIQALKLGQRLGTSYAIGYIREGRPELLDWYKKIGFYETGQVVPDWAYPSNLPRTTQDTSNLIVIRKELNFATSKL